MRYPCTIRAVTGIARSVKGRLEPLRNKDRLVYAKPPFGGPEHVLKYLARYTHRVAISNQRLVSVSDGKVTFRYKDYAQQNAQRTMSLDAVEFLRRFLLHTLPSGFMRIRYYGFLANRHRAEKLHRARQLLGQNTSSTGNEPSAPSTRHCSPHTRPAKRPFAPIQYP